DVGVALEQVQHWKIRGGLAIGHRGTLQHQPVVGAVRTDELVHQARLADTGLPDQPPPLAMPPPRLLLSVAEGLEFRLPPHKAGQPPCGAGLQAAADRTGPNKLAYLPCLAQPFDRKLPQGIDLHQSFDQPQGASSQPDAAWGSEL